MIMKENCDRPKYQTKVNRQVSACAIAMTLVIVGTLTAPLHPAVLMISL